jgi:tetratricopeptide (TPR) repeat protein
MSPSDLYADSLELTVRQNSEKDPNLALTYCEDGNKLLAAKEYAQARSAYQKAIECNPLLAKAYSGLATTYHLLQDPEGALALWDRASEIAPTEIEFYHQRALVSKSLRNYDRVIADCQKILAQFPHHPSARWLNAVAFFKLEQYQVALFNFNQHVDAHPQDPSGYCYRGICYERLEKYPQALADFERAIVLQPCQPIYYHARGRVHQRLGDFYSALADFDLAISYSLNATTESNSQLAGVYDSRAEVHRCRGDYLAALQDGDRAIELNPKFVDAYFRRGLTYAELGDLELALLDYRSTIALDRHHINAYIQRSWIYFRQKDYQRAKQDCQSINIFNPACFCSNYMLGVINSLSGLKHDAITNFSKAIEILPNYVSARYHRGVIYHELGDLPQALADFEQARSIQDRGLERLIDRDETGFYAEGLALYHLGQPEAARTLLLLGALSAKRFNNHSFHQLILFNIEALGLSSSDLLDR